MLTLSEEKAAVTGKVQTGSVLVDGLGVGDVGSVVINERKKLSVGGIVVIAASYDPVNHEFLSRPELHSRGLVYVKEYGALLDETRENLEDALAFADLEHMNVQAVRDFMKSTVRKFIYNRTNREPIILSVITTVD